MAVGLPVTLVLYTSAVRLHSEVDNLLRYLNMQKSEDSRRLQVRWYRVLRDWYSEIFPRLVKCDFQARKQLTIFVPTAPNPHRIIPSTSISNRTITKPQHTQQAIPQTRIRKRGILPQPFSKSQPQHATSRLPISGTRTMSLANE